jgi:hypothetical protein
MCGIATWLEQGAREALHRGGVVVHVPDLPPFRSVRHVARTAGST